MNLERYVRQITLPQIGKDGQLKLLNSRVAILGMGALGSVIANKLARAGVGFLRLVDRDYVSFNNLQRCDLYTTADAEQQLPKVAAASAKLAAINPDVQIEALASDINSTNIESLIADVDLVLDGSDNVELRQLLNEAAFKLEKPWIYGGALANDGAVMNILPGGACFKCLVPVTPAPGSYPSCATAGVLNTATSVVASIQASEAIKLLLGSGDVCKDYISLSLWNTSFDMVHIEKNPDCSLCAREEYEYLGKASGSHTLSLCGRDEVQVAPNGKAEINLQVFAEKLEPLGKVKTNSFLLDFDDGKVNFKLFKDGRAIIKSDDPAAALSIYSEFVGL